MMKIFEVIFWDKPTEIIYAVTRQEIRRNYTGVKEIIRLEIH